MAENPTQASFDDLPAETGEQIDHQRAYDSLPPRHIMSMVAATDSPFPYMDGDVIVLGPEVFHNERGVITYKGENYYTAEVSPPRPEGDMFGRAFASQDMFRAVFASQDRFQRLLGHDLTEYDEETKAGYLKDQILALLDEAHEALNEVGWKPWATSRHVNHKEFAGELADVLCFLVNLALGVGLSADDLFELHQEKVLRNIKRQEEKYDGVAGKCPGCKRAIDDLRAKGLPIGTFGGVDYCSADCIERANPSHFAPSANPR